MSTIYPLSFNHIEKRQMDYLGRVFVGTQELTMSISIYGPVKVGNQVAMSYDMPIFAVFTRATRK